VKKAAAVNQKQRIKKTFYQREGSKWAELWTLLHIYFTFMCISFFSIGVGISDNTNWLVLLGGAIAYFFGLQAAHFFDQTPSAQETGTKYTKLLTPKELLSLGILSAIIAFGIGIYFTIEWKAWHMLWLMPLQGFFVVAYPVAKLFKGFFHNDFWFALSFGFMPVAVGFYANTLTLSWIIIPFGVLCFLLSLMEITLSRHVRKLRKIAAESMNVTPVNIDATATINRTTQGNWNWVIVEKPQKLNSQISIEECIAKPERALQLLCITSYLLAICTFIV